MSLLLLLYDTSGEPLPGDVNQYIRRVDEWEMSYNLGSTATFRCQVIDPKTDTASAFRPAQNSRVIIRNAETGLPIFRGRIVQAQNAPIEEPNVGTKYSISCIGESEVFDDRHVTTTFGSDPLPIQVSFFSTGGTTRIHTVDPHSFSAGDEITIELLTYPTGAASEINGDRVVASVLDPYEFTINVATQLSGDAYGGTVRKRVRLRTILQALENPYLTDYGYSLAPDIELGPLLEVQKFEDATINDIYRHLSKITGWVHRWLPTRVAEWFEPGTKISALTFDKSAVLSGTGWTQARIKNANTVILKYGGNQQVSVSETATGNGVNRVWPLVHKPIVNKPITSTSAQINIVVPEGDGGAYVMRHVGVYGYDTLFEWVYRESDNSLVQLAVSAGVGNAPKPAGWVGIINITEQLPATVKVDDGIVAGGPREKLLEAPGIVDRNAALQLARAELGGLAVTPKEAKLVTEAGLTWPGNSALVELPHIKMTGQFLITGFSAIETEREIRYTYTAIEGNEFTATWQERLRNLFGGGAGGGSTVLSGSITTVNTGGGGGGGGTVLGTPGVIPKFTATTAIGDSPINVSPDDSLVSTAAAIQSTQMVSAPVFRGLATVDADGVFQNAAGSAVFDVPPSTRHARFYGDVITNRVYSEGDLTLGSPNNVVYPVGNYQTHLGGVTRKWLTVHAAELWVEQLVAQDTIATIGGSILVAPTTTLTADLPLAATSIQVKHNQMVVGDRVMLKSFGKFEILNITGGPTGAGPYTYTVTRNADGSGANDWFAGDAILNTRQTGHGFLDIYSERGTKSALEVGPSMVANVRFDNTATGWEPRAAFGNLNGVYGYATNIYGVAAGKRTGAWFSVDETNGLRMMHNNTVFAQITAAGAASFTGSVTITGGSGLLNLTDVPTPLKAPTGAGLYLGSSFMGYYNGTVWKSYFDNAGNMHLGNWSSSGYGMFWNQTAGTLNIRGTINADSGYIGGWSISGGQLGPNTPGTSGLYLNPSIMGYYNATGGFWQSYMTSGGLFALLRSDGSVGLAWDGTTLTIGGGGSSYVPIGGAAADVNANVTTISGGKITTGSITADKLSVGTLSAITADLGTVTAGSLTGVTITGGNTTLDGNGITLAAGSGTSQRIKWTDGSDIWGGSNFLWLNANAVVALHSGSAQAQWNNDASFTGHNAGCSLGASWAVWDHLYINPPTDPAGAYEILMLNMSDHQVHRGTGAYTGDIFTGGDTLHVFNGIIRGIN